jgi:hypothetical protein
MRIKYGVAIKESEEELRKVEEHWRGQKVADRVRLLRLLKSGRVNSLRVLCPSGGLQCDPGHPVVGTLSSVWPRQPPQAA